MGRPRRAGDRAGTALLEPGSLQNSQKQPTPLVQGRAESRALDGFRSYLCRWRQDLVEARDDPGGFLWAGARQADPAYKWHDSRWYLGGELPELDSLRGSFHGRRQDVD